MVIRLDMKSGGEILRIYAGDRKLTRIVVIEWQLKVMIEPRRYKKRQTTLDRTC